MRAVIVVNVTRDDRRRLEAIVADRSAPQKHVPLGGPGPRLTRSRIGTVRILAAFVTPDRLADRPQRRSAGAKAEIQSPSRRTSCILIHGFTKENIMMRSSWMGALAAMAFSASLGPAAAQSGVQVGVLECRGSGSISFVIGSVHEFTCIFNPAAGRSCLTMASCGRSASTSA